MNLPEKIVAVHLALRGAAIPHAFGGALALAWCTQQARGTNDIDVNLFVSPDRATDVLAALVDIAPSSDADLATIERDGQVADAISHEFSPPRSNLTPLSRLLSGSR